MCTWRGYHWLWRDAKHAKHKLDMEFQQQSKIVTMKNAVVVSQTALDKHCSSWHGQHSVHYQHSQHQAQSTELKVSESTLIHHTTHYTLTSSTFTTAHEVNTTIMHASPHMPQCLSSHGRSTHASLTYNYYLLLFYSPFQFRETFSHRQLNWAKTNALKQSSLKHIQNSIQFAIKERQ